MFTSEDPMELSSDMDRRQIMDVDIDVDLDLTVEQAFEREDDYMAEDYNPGADQDLFGRPLLQGRDDDMLDGEYSVPEAEEKLSVPDEQLDDATYLGPEEHIIFLPAIQEVSEFEVNADLTGDLSPNHELDTSPLNHGQAELASGLSVTGEIDVSEHFAEITPSESQGPQFGEAPESSYDPDDTGAASEQQTPSEVLSPTQTTVQELDSTWDGPIIRGEEGPSFSSPSVTDGAALSSTFLIPNETDSTYLGPILPVTLIYQDTEMSLFPPADGDQTTYFLSDEGLVSQNIEDLFEACRIVLAGTIEDEEKLEFSIDDLGLRLSESTIESSTLNLADLIGLYLQLQSHDGMKNPRPLCLKLRTKYEFSTRWKYLKNHLAKGKGLSQLTTVTRITEESQPQDPHIDHGHLEQSHPDTSKPVSETELRGEDLNNTKEVDDGGLSSALFEEARIDSQLDKATTPVDDLHEGEPDTVTIENRSETHPTAAVAFEDSISAQAANALTGDLSNSQLEAAVIPDQKHSSSEPGDLIDYDNEGEYDEDDNYPGTSTGSSTIQGDVLETVSDYLGRPLNGTTMPEQEDEIARFTTLESDSIPVLDDQLILRSISDGKAGDHPHAIPDTDNGRNWNAATKYRENRENLNAFTQRDLSEVNFIVETEGYKPDFQGTEMPTSIRELHTRRESNDGSGTRHNHGDSIIIMGNPEARQEEELIPENNGYEPLTSPINRAIETENKKETFDRRGSFLEQPAQTSARVDDMDHFTEDKRNKNTGVDLLKDSHDLSIPKIISQSQTPITTENPQGKPADDDEITYEGDGNDPQPSRTYTHTQISQLTPPLKRTRSDLEDSDPVDSSPKGEDQ
ncbi:hypothetical protein MMC31_007515 [Peltigera leucophlebia]|nr:hypothetical protein [Peltigera leucophlebia]